MVSTLADRMRPAKGQPWASRDHRNADELADLFETTEAPVAAAKPLLVVEVPLSGPAEVAGIPLPDATVEALRSSARIEPVLVDDDGVRVAVGRRAATLSPKITRAVLLRDAHCRMPGCEMRHGLQVHDLRPRSWGGTDEVANLAAVCRTHHSMLVPAGRRALVGNPNRPDGLTLMGTDRLTEQQAEPLGLPPPRAQPAA
jgi:hypothetical protein